MLQARFTTDRAAIDAAVAHIVLNDAAPAPHLVIESTATRTVVVGPNHDVMRLIGTLADMGESGLRLVSEV